MPKLKTHRGAAKRFRARGDGVKFRRVNRNHILTKKSPKRMLQARAQGQIKACDLNEVKRLLHGS